MPRIIENTTTEAQHDWPEDVFIQGGERGVVVGGPNGAYQTAFFEAFPSDPRSGFMRGEGAGFCTRCGTWMSRVLPPLPEEDDPDRPRSLVERIFIDQEPEAVEEVLQTMANAADLPPAPNAD